MRKVMIVVPVFMTSCQVSLNPNMGPVRAQTKMMRTAATKVPVKDCNQIEDGDDPN
jgi:hypothetical protein